MLGGGSFTIQNKQLPGAYINFVSAAGGTSVLSERGVVAVPLVMDWGPEKKAFTVTGEEFSRDTRKLLGYSHDAAELMPLQEIFCHALSCVVYRLNAGEKAQNTLAEAKYSGTRGNQIRIVVAQNPDSEGKMDVTTLLDGREVDKQTVAGMGALKDNDFVAWKREGTLEATAGTPLTGGTNGEAVTGEDHAAFLDAMEAESFHVLCCPAVDDSTKAVYTAFTKRLREEVGVKFQTVVYRKSDADYEGVISVENKTEEMEQGMVYWVSGLAAACEINKTNENTAYDGHYTVDLAYTQQQLADAISSGKFILHRVNGAARVLLDINTLTSFTEEKKAEFGDNQTVRVLDQIGNDIAAMFNTQFFGKMPNDASGRISLWNAVTTYMKKLADIRAVEAVETESVQVSAGESRRAVVVELPVKPISCMSHLYMTVVVE